MTSAWEVLRSEVPRWWKDVNASWRTDITPADVAETGFNLVGGVGTGLATYAPEAEAKIKGGAKASGVVGKTVAALRKPKSASYAGDPLDFVREKLRTQYPEQLPGVMTTDPKSGKQYLAKQLSEEANVVASARKAAQKDIDKGNYTPLFDVTKRAHVDAKNYPLEGNTLTDAMPKKQATTDKWRAQFDTPETRARLSQAYLRAKPDPLTGDWYAMKQLEDKYIEELGPTAGRAAFKELWDATAATTGGADPTSNLLMAHYGNFLRAQGKRAPEAAHEMPFPIGGRYASGNLAMYNKVLNDQNPLTAAGQPKRFNFASNFLGHRDRATIDEQMMGGFDPTGKLAAPPGDSYGVTEAIVGDLAKQHGVQPQNFQDVTWAGLKGTTGKPMITHVNEALERTARITGLTPEQVLRLNLIRKQGPLYAGGGVAVSQQDQLQGE